MGDISRYKNILLVLVICVFIFIIGKNMFADFNNQKQGFVKDRDKVKEYEELIDQWTILNRKYNETKKGLFDDPFTFKKFVEGKARNHDIRIETFRPSEEDKGFFLQENIELSFRATYRDAVEFVSSLKEKNIKVIRITMNQSGSKGTVDVRLRLEGIVIKNGG